MSSTVHFICLGSRLRFSSIYVSLKSYADDVKLYSIIDGAYRIDNLQYATDAIHAWSLKWQLPISMNKCFVMDVGSAKKIDEYLPNTVNGQVLRFSDSAKDLGVLLDSSLSFFPHIADIVVKARQRVLLLFKVFTTRSCTHLIRAYKTFIRPILEFNSQIWLARLAIFHS